MGVQPKKEMSMSPYLNQQQTSQTNNKSAVFTATTQVRPVNNNTSNQFPNFSTTQSINVQMNSSDKFSGFAQTQRPAVSNDVVLRLREINQMRLDGLLNDDEFSAAKRAVLGTWM